MQLPDKNHYHILGIMSGSSLDGVDFAFCEFKKTKNKWNYQIIHAETIPYSAYWIDRLKSSSDLSGNELIKTHIEYGQFLGEISKEMINKHGFKPDTIASHGHTVFHEPDSGFTYQLGDGQTLAVKSGQTVVCDFRSKDISLGGQGAPLVPIGDEQLFGDYKACLNIGGIANISYNSEGKRIAYDICPANQLLNYLANQFGELYDDEGKHAESGIIIHDLLNKMNNDPFYLLNSPKSLSNQYVSEKFLRILKNSNDSIENKLRTTAEHIANQITIAINNINRGDILITGGGAYNSFLINLIKAGVSANVVIPNSKLIDFKEALIFAFMGMLRIRNEVNCLASVTGAKSDSSGGIIFHP